MRTLRTISLALGLGTLAACNSVEFADPDMVGKDRVLAGRVVTAVEPSRTTPAPGEAATYELLVGGPTADATWSYMLAVCRFVRDENGSPNCDPTQPPLAFTGTTPLSSLYPELPHVDFTVPAAESLRADESDLLVQGMVCPGGAFDDKILEAIAAGDYSALAAGRNPCAEKHKNGVVIASSFPIARTPEANNHAPQIERVFWSKAADDGDDGDDETVVAGMPWRQEAPNASPAEGCEGQGFDEIPKNQRIAIQLQLDEAARETYADPSPIPGAPPTMRSEIPQVQGLASGGTFSIVRDNQLEPNQLLQLEWMVSEKAKLPEDGLLVRFWFLATDDRYGDTQATSWQSRALCVIGP